MNAFIQAWTSFWFHPRSATTLAIIRIATGAMLAYVHAVWCLGLTDFMGKHALVDNPLIQRLHRDDFTWSYLWNIDSMSLLWTHQCVAILASIAMCLGLFTRLVIPLVWFMTLMVCHRMTGFLFGLDQVVMMLAMYLMIAPAGNTMSLDSRLAKRFLSSNGPSSFSRWLFPSASPSSMVTVSTRLIQIHLCIVYLFGGISKLRGEMWWDGTAMWFSAVAYEYQSLDLTWIGRYPIFGAILTHVTVFWETFYCALVWQRWSRFVMLGLAVLVHGGIAIYLGMITFGWMMIVANFAFIEPEWIERFAKRGEK